MFRPAALLVWIVSLFAPSVSAAQPATTQEVSLQYLAFDAAIDHDGLSTVMSEDMVFSDPTGNVFSGPVAKGPIHGKSAILQLMKGWNLGAVRFEPDLSFYVGDYALHRGTYQVQYVGAAQWYSIPFVTIHRVQDGKVVERTDFGEYISSFQLGNRFDAATQSTQTISDQYLQAYLDNDLQTQDTLLHESVQFQDPTSKVFGPPSGQLFRTKTALIERRRAIFSQISNFDFLIVNRFTANNHSVFVGEVTYQTAQGVVYQQPAVFVIEVRDGLVTQHWDFVDYTVGPVQ